MLLTSGAICRSSGTQPDAFILKYWTVYTDTANIQPVIDAYQIKYPYISIELTQFRPEEYEDKLIEAWAQGEDQTSFLFPTTT